MNMEVMLVVQEEIQTLGELTRTRIDGIKDTLVEKQAQARKDGLDYEKGR